MGDKLEIVKKYLTDNCFQFVGKGVDSGGFDYMYKQV